MSLPWENQSTSLTRGRIIKNDIQNLPLDRIVDEGSAEEFVAEFKLKKAWLWFGPQLLAHLAKYVLPEKNEEGMYDGLEFLKLNTSTSMDKGLYWLLVKMHRSEIMGTQTDPHNIQYCGLVPIYMAAQKKFNKVPYSKWTNLDLLVHKMLWEAMQCPHLPPEITAKEILETRHEGLRGKSPITFNSLVGISATELGKLPRYAQAMIAQFWCAHPSHRHQYMVLDPYNWDNIPDSLIPSEVLVTPPSESGVRSLIRQKMPWE